MNVRKEYPQRTKKKQAKTINEKNKTFAVLNTDNDDYVTKNSWKPFFIRMGNY